MTNSTLLVLDFSPRGPLSVSNKLTTRFTEAWRRTRPDATVLHRDLGATPPPHLDGETIGAFYTPPEERSEEQARLVALSDALVDDLEAADVIVLGLPMFNFGSPSGFKAWIDQVARVGRTFRYTENGPEGLLGGREVVVLTARGGNYAEGSPFAVFDQQTPYVRTVFGFLGLSDVTFIHAHGQAGGEGAAAAGRVEAEAAIDALVAEMGERAAA